MIIRDVIPVNDRTLLWCGSSSTTSSGIMEQTHQFRSKPKLLVDIANKECLCMTLNSDGSLLAVGTSLGEIVVFEWPSGKHRCTVTTSCGDITSVRFFRHTELNELLFQCDALIGSVALPTSGTAELVWEKELERPNHFVLESTQLSESPTTPFRGALAPISSSAMLAVGRKEVFLVVKGGDGLCQFPVHFSNDDDTIVDVALSFDRKIWILTKKKALVFLATACAAAAADVNTPLAPLALELVQIDNTAETLSCVSACNEVTTTSSAASSSVDCAVVIGYWTAELVFRVNRVTLIGDDGSLGKNELLGEVNFLNGGERIVWVGSLGEGGSQLVVARERDGWVGMEMPVDPTSVPAADEVEVVPCGALETTDRQESDDTVMIGEELAELPIPAAECKVVTEKGAEEATEPGSEVTAREAEAPGPEARTKPTERINGGGDNVGEFHSDESINATLVAPSTGAPEAAPVAQGKTRNTNAVTSKNLSTPPTQVTKEKSQPKPDRSKKAIPVEKSSDISIKASKDAKQKAAAPPLELPPQKPAVPTRATTPLRVKKLRQEVDASKNNTTTTECSVSQGVVASLLPKGAAVEIALDTHDIEDLSSQMNDYVFTKLLGEGRDMEPRFIPLPTPTFSLQDVISAVERTYRRRVSVAFAMPTGKLIELKPSSLKLFQNLESADRQLYCRSLFPVIDESAALETSCPTKRAATPMVGLNVSDIHDVSAALSDDVLISRAALHHHRLSKQQQESSNQRLHNASMIAMAKKRVLLERKYAPREDHPSTISKDRSVDLVERLYHKFATEKEAKLEKLRKEADEREFGSKEPIKKSAEEIKDITSRFYDKALEDDKERIRKLEEKLLFQKPTSKKLSSADEWAEWQEKMSRQIGRKFKVKDPYGEGAAT